MYIAVIDTETNWEDRVMSLGIVVADARTFRPVDYRYYVIEPECDVEGMFSGVLYAVDDEDTRCLDRGTALSETAEWLRACGVRRLFAYNATFDCTRLPELSGFDWYDIMSLASNRNYNRKIPAEADCLSNGRLKRGFGVNPIYRLMTGDMDYSETHNALLDAIDELTIMRLMGHDVETYECALIKSAKHIDRKSMERRMRFF